MLRFVQLLAGGIAVGLAVGFVVNFFGKRFDDGSIEVTLSFIAPYTAYLGAEHFHCSGVLASVAAGLYLGNRSSQSFSSSARIQARGFWDTLEFVLNGVVFLLIGLQLPAVLHDTRPVPSMELWIDLAQLLIGIILLRLIWVFPAAQCAYLIRRRLLGQKVTIPSRGELFVEGWTGMRGAISLAAALALPETIANGRPFPQRNLIIVLTFGLIFITLVLQELSLPPIIRKLGLAGQLEEDTEGSEARLKISQAALAVIEEHQSEDTSELRAVYDDLRQLYRARVVHLTGVSEHRLSPKAQSRYRDIARGLRKVERKVALELRAKNEISDHLVRDLERDLDLLDERE